MTATASSATVVRIDVTSSATELRSATRDRALRSLDFFLSTVLRLSLSEGAAAELQLLGPKRLAELSEGLALWARLRGARPPADPAKTDAIRWIFPETRE